MDPDAVLQQLREFYNLLQDNDYTAADFEEMAVAFDALDNWIIAGGFLPKAWQNA